MRDFRHVSALALLLLLASGCSGPPPQLRYVAYGVDGSVHPIQFGLSMANDGDAPVDVDAVDAVIHDARVFAAGDAVAKLPSFDPVVRLMRPGFAGAMEPAGPGKPVTLAPGATTDLLLAVAWKILENPPPGLAICTASFQLKQGGDVLLETSPVTFLVESRRGVLALMKSDFADDPEMAVALRQDLEQRQGDRTAEVKALEEFLDSLPRGQ